MTAAEEARAWLAEHWDPDLAVRAWRDQLADSGWGCPAWPERWYGRGLPLTDAAAVRREFAAVGAVGVAAGSGMNLAAPTLLRHGSDELLGRVLRPTLTGERTWCQLFSEPGSGSDLAGLTTRAVRDGDEWVVSGQKVWTTGARSADWAMLLARTDSSVPKHEGITYFVLPMDQPGVEVRPLHQMNRHASFNEVFLTEARVPHANVVGELGGGWNGARTTLANERGLQGGIAGTVPPGATGRCAEEARAELEEYRRTYVWYPQRAGRADLLVRRAQETGSASDPVRRQGVVHALALERTSKWTVERAEAARAAGRQPGPEGSLAKLLGSEIARRSARSHAALSGAEALLTGPDSAHGGIVAEVLVSVPAVSIAGGTDEIQHNIVGERVLGLPREPVVDRGVPFSGVATNRNKER